MENNMVGDIYYQCVNDDETKLILFIRVNETQTLILESYIEGSQKGTFTKTIKTKQETDTFLKDLIAESEQTLLKTFNKTQEETLKDN